jgi:hypothetical protein
LFFFSVAVDDHIFVGGDFAIGPGFRLPGGERDPVHALP